MKEFFNRREQREGKNLGGRKGREAGFNRR
jgi:hypothetical protein